MVQATHTLSLAAAKTTEALAIPSDATHVAFVMPATATGNIELKVSMDGTTYQWVTAYNNSQGAFAVRVAIGGFRFLQFVFAVNQTIDIKLAFVRE